MRDVILTVAVLVGLVATLRFPFAGVLLWTWFTSMDPQQEIFGFARSFQFNLVVAAFTLLLVLVSTEKKFPPMRTATVALVLFLGWMTLNSFYAVDPEWSWPLWDRTWRTIALGLLIIPVTNTKARFHAIVWIVVISLFFYGVKGGIFTLTTGGGGHVVGPPLSMIEDNNQLALALAMVLPVANYLRRYTANRWISYGLLAGMMLTAVAVIGTYSRGGLVTLLGLAMISWLRTRNRFIYPVVAAAVIIPAVFFMPQAYNTRISTIGSAQTDESFQGRLQAWEVAWDYAVDHFPMGDGFSGAERPEVFNRYMPGKTTHAAHSIFFEVLGDLGFMGLTIYLVMLASAFGYLSRVRRLARTNEDLGWASDLANMLQLSLFAFCLGGSALSMAYYDMFFIWVGLSLSLCVYVENECFGSQKARFGVRTIATPKPVRVRREREVET